MKQWYEDGSAFPLPESDKDAVQYGMSLRDYFAGRAMQGYCSGAVWPKPADFDHIARSAYKIADAMLKARQS